MAFPTSLDTLTTGIGTSGQPLSSPNHITQHTNESTAIQALETKVGIDGSAVTTTHDYKLSGVTGSDKAVSKTGSETLTNKTLTAPVIATIVNTGTLTLPAATDTLVGRATTDTLTNKTIVGANNTISGITEAMLSTSDLTTLDVTTSKHGFVPKAPNDTTKFLRGDATWALAPASSYVGAPTTKSSSTTENVDTTFTCSFTPKNITIYYRLHGKSGGTEQYSYGIATFNGTTLVSNMWLKKNLATDTLSAGVPTIDTASPVAGAVSGSYSTVTISVPTVTAGTSFVVRSAHATGDSSGSDSTYYVVATG